ncbi:MAG: MBL fold metallo-hydrolase [Burkholderiales bacterium]
MRFASLGSGSEGNALIVEVAQSRVMLDCGFSISETLFRLQRLGLEAEQLDGIVVTHEHSDHIGGVARLARRYDIPVYFTHGTYTMTDPSQWPENGVNIIDSHTPFYIGDIEVLPYPVPHDAREPTQFVFTDGARRLGVLTDTGCSTPHIEASLSGLDALVLECNHDLDLLMGGPYPQSLKQRVAGRLGHLDNQTAAALLGKISHDRMKHVIAAHLSRKNNTPELACAALAAALGCESNWIGVAGQKDGFAWRGLN